jgi:hypothetical protein
MQLYLGSTDATLYVTPYFSIDSDETHFLVTIGWLYWEIGLLFGELE